MIIYYLLFLRNNETMEDVNKNNLEKNISKYKLNKDNNKDDDFYKKRLKASLDKIHRRDLSIIKKIANISKNLDDNVKDVNSW